MNQVVDVEKTRVRWEDQIVGIEVLVALGAVDARIVVGVAPIHDRLRNFAPGDSVVERETEEQRQLLFVRAVHVDDGAEVGREYLDRKAVDIHRP
ncbi:hypothetical protein D3C83_89130 [compost metagenome]